MTCEDNTLYNQILIVYSTRPTSQKCLQSAWFHKAIISGSSSIPPKPIPTSRLADFVERKRHQVKIIVKILFITNSRVFNSLES